ncbi:hypothetical protein [Vibrio parahaemolyticus]|uniref:hypothetical protein n=1 Tax=Vibrio parahaemolyticus TaxID=670 RepID=UPI003892C4A4
MLDKKTKFKLSNMDTGNLFFPNPDEFMKSLGFNVSPRSKIKKFAKESSIEIEISDRSLDSLLKRGISLKLARKLFRNLSKSDFFKWIRRNVNVGNLPKNCWDNGKFWLISLELTMLLSDEFDFLPFERFLTKRHEQNQTVVMWLENNKKMPQTEREQIAWLLEHYGIVLPLTSLEASRHETIKQALEEIVKAEFQGVDVFDIPNQEIQDIVLIQYDFHLSMLAAFDLSICSLESGDYCSFFSEIMKREGNCYFAKYLGWFIDLTNSTQYELGICVPVNYKDTGSGRTLEQVQRETLKDWMKGKTKPTWQTLERFFEKKLPSCDDVFYFQVIAWVCIGMDKLVGKNVRQEKLLRDMFDTHYLDYFNKIKQLQ